MMSSCYPGIFLHACFFLLLTIYSITTECGVPVITHLHGLESPARHDGVPTLAFGAGKKRTDVFKNTQMSSTKIYHDHAVGLTRLNAWAGLVGLYIIEDEQTEKSVNVWKSCDIPIVIGETSIDEDGSLLYNDAYCELQDTKWAPEGFGKIHM